MLARQWMVGTELGEDRHHHPAHEVATLWVLRLGDRRLEALQRALQVAGVPRGEASRERPGAVASVVAVLRGQPGPCRHPFGLKAPMKVIQQREGLGGLATSQEQPAELDGGLCVARIELQRLPKRRLVVSRREL